MNIKEIKLNGEIEALSCVIEGKIYKLKSTIEGHKNGRAFKGLHKKIEDARFVLDEIDELLTEVKKLDKTST
jgi:hypothetical protein